MLKSVASIFSQTVDGAERITGRVVGMGSYGNLPPGSVNASYSTGPTAPASALDDNGSHEVHVETNGVSNGINGHHDDMDIEENEEYDDAEEHNRSMEMGS